MRCQIAVVQTLVANKSSRILFQIGTIFSETKGK
jgi:hypothetical protein